MLNKELLELVCCPNCKGDLEYSAKKYTLRCKKCKAVYPVNDGIPVLIVQEKSGELETKKHTRKKLNGR